MQGIYCIENLVNNKCYVGSAIDIQKRWYDHKFNLSSKKHHSKKLQHAWDKYGEESFIFYVVEEVKTKTYLLRREQYWIDHLDTFNFGYNMVPTAGSRLGDKQSQETCKKISDSKTGSRHSDDTKKKMSQSQIKRFSLNLAPAKNFSQETKDRIAACNRSRAKTYYGFIDPEGNPIVIYNLCQFCANNNLRQGHMIDLINGKRKQERGYTFDKRQ